MSGDPPVPGHATPAPQADDRPDAVSDPWAPLRGMTPARVLLGRTGASLPTREILRFGHAHALARDAVHKAFDVTAVQGAVEALGLPCVAVSSMVADRAGYLRRPDLGRVLAPEDRMRLEGMRDGTVDLVIVIADGLSATAVHANAPALVAALLPGIRSAGWRLGPVVLASQARVALGDDVGAALGAGMVLVLIGERPGLSAADSLGAYLTHAPRRGRRDHERNCVSNIREAGLVPAAAAHSILWLMTEAVRRGETGVALKDESEQRSTITPARERAG